MKVEVSGGFAITIKRRRKRQESIEETEVESDTEVFRPGFQPNPEDAEGAEGRTRHHNGWGHRVRGGRLTWQ